MSSCSATSSTSTTSASSARKTSDENRSASPDDRAGPWRLRFDAVRHRNAPPGARSGTDAQAGSRAGALQVDHQLCGRPALHGQHAARLRRARCVGDRRRHSRRDQESQRRHEGHADLGDVGHDQEEPRHPPDRLWQGLGQHDRLSVPGAAARAVRGDPAVRRARLDLAVRRRHRAQEHRRRHLDRALPQHRRSQERAGLGDRAGPEHAGHQRSGDRLGRFVAQFGDRHQGRQRRRRRRDDQEVRHQLFRRRGAPGRPVAGAAHAGRAGCHRARRPAGARAVLELPGRQRQRASGGRRDPRLVRRDGSEPGRVDRVLPAPDARAPCLQRAARRLGQRRLQGSDLALP